MHKHKIFTPALGAIALLLPFAAAYASVSLSIQSLSPSTNIAAGTAVSFTVTASGFTDPVTYSVSDSFSGSSASNSNINSSGNFSWTPNQNDIGTHNFTITVSDSASNSGTVQEQITVSAAPSVSIQSLSPSSAINVGQAVSFTVVPSGFTNPSYSLSDSFNGSTVSNSNINSSGNFSWTPATQDAGSHNITVTVTDTSGHSATASEGLTVNSVATAVIQSLSPGSTIDQGQTITFTVAASGFSSPSYSLSDSFSGGTLSNSNINSSGNFSWTPATSDAGTHTITATVVDSSGHSATASQTITVHGPAIVIQGLSPGSTVAIGNPVTFTAYASNFTSPIYTVSDTFGGSTISNSAINSSSGYFNWTPTANEIGTHNITIWATDSSGHSANVVQQIVVQSPNITITSVNPSTSVNSGTQLSFAVVPAGFTNPSYTISDSYGGTTISNSNINSSGYFTWTPTSNESGTHTITVYATDSYGHSANTSITIYVNSNISLSLSAPSPSSAVTPGTVVVFNAYPYGFTSPSFAITDSFSGTSVNNSNINSSGYFSWVPTANDAGTHSITVMATDSYSHSANANTQITVSGTAPATASQPLHVFNVYLSLGATGDDVSALQTILTEQGFFSGPVTGYYGSLTANAVKKFQTANGISALGVVGPQTRTTLNQLVSSPSADALRSQLQTLQSKLAELQAQAQQGGSSTASSYKFLNPLSFGSRGADVTELQKRLAAEGVYSGPITGYYGSLTKLAVQRYQAKYSLQQLGNVGPATRAQLNR